MDPSVDEQQYRAGTCIWLYRNIEKLGVVRKYSLVEDRPAEMLSKKEVQGSLYLNAALFQWCAHNRNSPLSYTSRALLSQEKVYLNLLAENTKPRNSLPTLFLKPIVEVMAELAECRFIMDVWVHLYIAMLQYLVMICDGMLFMHLTKKFWY